MNENTRIVEIKGVKLEVDLREAKTIEKYKVGDNVKVLIKKYDDYKSHPGVIVGFDNFLTLPTIVIAYLEVGYKEATVEFAYFNEKSKDIEICPMTKEDKVISYRTATQMLDREIESKRKGMQDLEMKKSYFKENYEKFFEETK